MDNARHAALAFIVQCFDDFVDQLRFALFYQAHRDVEAAQFIDSQKYP